MIKNFLYIFILLSATLICHESASHQASRACARYKAPAVTSYTTSNPDTANYLVAHYWDNFNPSDKAILDSDTVIDQSFSNFISLSKSAHPDSVLAAFKHLLSIAGNSPQVTERLLKIAEKHLYNRESPYRDDVTFSKFIRYSNLKCLDEYQQFYWDRLAVISSLNNPASPANNFTFFDSLNNKCDLYSIDSKYILLVFIDPDCEDCHNLKSRINSAAIPLNCKTLTIYSGDDIQLWRKSIENSNPLWINGLDKDSQIIDSELYDIRSYPTIYLLDKDKNVILKDAHFDEVVKYFTLHDS